MTETPAVEVVGGGTPTDEEMAAITAAIEAAWPRPTATGDADGPGGAPPRWRFSGRWWSKPVPIRRDRPF